MDLKEFYFQHIESNEYHHRFYDSIKNANLTHNIFIGCVETNDYNFEVYDVEEAITKFKDLCEPNTNVSSVENACWFYLITYYLYKMGYELKEFPKVLARPPIDPFDFTYKEIRTRLISLGKDDNGTVRYDVRRNFVANFTFELKTTSNCIDIDEVIKQKFIEISTRQAYFNDMSMDEKLKEIANLIENMLKKNGKFVTLDYSQICFDYISNNTVTNYRKKIQCFRHATNEAILERKSYSEDQKNFLINFGLTIINVINSLISE